MTNEEILEAKRLAEAATPGPWAYEYPARHYQHILAVGPGNPAMGQAIANTWFDPDSDRQGREQDAAFIAAARTLVPTLADDLLEARRRLSETKRLLREFVKRTRVVSSDVAFGDLWEAVEAAVKE